MERQMVEYTFMGEKLAFAHNEYGDLTLYRTDEDTYFVHLDARGRRQRGPRNRGD